MMKAILLLLEVHIVAAALAACAPRIAVPQTVYVNVPVACVDAAKRPPRPQLRTEADLMAMDRYRRTLAAWSDKVKLEAWAAELEAIVEGCSRLTR